MTLQNLQAEFAESIFSDDPQVELLQPARHLIIYRNNISSNLIQALQHTYPLITQLVGVDFFRVAAKEYVERYPSRSGNLHDYGEYFKDFLAEYEPVKNLIYLVEVATFEWLCHSLTLAPDHALLNTALLESLSPDQYGELHFMLHPASHLYQFHFPILRIIELCQAHVENDEPLHLDTSLLNLLIIRRDLDIILAPLTAGEFTFLSALQQNKTLSLALEEAHRIDPHFKLDEKLPGWITDKTIVDCF